ncbi:MAG TPA: DinB family protein [Methylomirabilota bacterium]|nr:DinB family protein [Methylomirabilota bacterium]
MPTREEYLRQPVEQRLARLERTPGDLAEGIRGQDDGALGRRPDARSWSATEILCHLRDIEELCILRFHAMLAMDDPAVFVVGAPPADPARWGIGDEVPFPLDPERWAQERQYSRSDPRLALAAFGRRRRELLALLGKLTPEEWRRGSIHPVHGRVTFADWTAGMAGHDDNHLDQLTRALDGRP